MKIENTGLALRIAIAVGGLVPVSAGLSGMIFGLSMFGDIDLHLGGDADSHYRYLSGLLLAIGVGFWSAIPAIERRTARFRLLATIVFVGGLARLGGVIGTGIVSKAMLAALAMELVVTPLLCLWQAQVSRRTGSPLSFR